MTDDRRPATVKTKRFFLSSVTGPRSTRYSSTSALANGSCRRPPHPSSETSRTIPSRDKERWRNSPPGGWAPGLRHPLAYPGEPGRPSRPGSPSRDLGQTRFRRVQAQLPSPSRRYPRFSSSGIYFVLRQHLRAPSDIAGSGGAPRQATAWETEARSMRVFFAGSVNTEGPRP